MSDLARSASRGKFTFAKKNSINFRPLFKSFYYAFVMFETIEAAKKAAEEHRYPIIKGGCMSRALPYNNHALRGEPGGKDIQSTSVFVKGFEKMKWTHADLHQKFCQYGKIQSCKVSVDPEHNFLGFGYIQYCRLEEAQKAIKEVSFDPNNQTQYFRWTTTTSPKMAMELRES